MDIVKDFQALFAEMGWTQVKWAQVTGIPQAGISRLVNGRGLNARNTAKILPFLYGPQRPDVSKAAA